MNNENVYAPDLAEMGTPYGVIGKGDSGPPCFIGIGIRKKEGWKVQWYQYETEDGFQPFESQVEAMGEPKVIAFTPVMADWFGMKIKTSLPQDNG